MSITNEQMALLAAGIRASSDPVVVAALAIRDDVTLHKWCNTAASPIQNAWSESVEAKAMFEAMNLATYDSVAAGKRAAWDIMLRNAPLDFSRLKIRKAVLDIFASADATTLLTDMLRPATNAEIIFGGTPATSGTVTALKLNLPGAVSLWDVSTSLNRS